MAEKKGSGQRLENSTRTWVLSSRHEHIDGSKAAGRLNTRADGRGPPKSTSTARSGLVSNRSVSGLSSAEDCGAPVNSIFVEGQRLGATVISLPSALRKHAASCEYDPAFSDAFIDCAIARTADLPAFTLSQHDTPRPVTPADIKGTPKGGNGVHIDAGDDVPARSCTRPNGQPAMPAPI
jgi:hypothetical protein